MTLTFFEIINIIAELFTLYIIQKFMRVFFPIKPHLKVFAVFGYVAYFIITISFYFLFDTPIINTLVNIPLFFALTFFYKSDMKKRIWASFFMYVILAMVELSITVITISPVFSWFQELGYSNVLGLFAIKMVQFLIVLIMQMSFHNKSKGKVSVLFLSASIIIPITSIFVMIIITSIEGITQQNIIFIIALLFFINIIVFFLYDSFSSLYEKQLKAATMEQEYLHQIQLIQMRDTMLSKSIQEQEESFYQLKESVHNHKHAIIALKSMLETEDYAGIQKYIDSEFTKFEDNSRHLSTGNLTVDTILNNKRSIARKNGIHFTTNISMPEKIVISDLDLANVLGNLLDNAIEALDTQAEKNLHVQISEQKGFLFIKIINTFSEENRIPVSRPNKKIIHGIGIKSVDRILQSYQGNLTLTQKNDSFTAVATIPLT